MSDQLRILLSGGGTGGHVYPALAVAATAAASARDVDFRFVGSAHGLERDIVARTSVPYDAIDAGAFRGRSPLAALVSIWRNLRGAGQSLSLLRRYQPDAILVTGGFVCVPVALAARMLGVPVAVYLPDLRPGWAVRFVARFATVVAVSFDDVVDHVTARRVVVTGYPVRPEFGSWDRAKGRASLGIPDVLPLVLVLGGSRGARNINEAMVGGASEVTARAYVIHATGALHIDAMRDQIGQLPSTVQERYRLFPYLETEIAPALAAASIVIARAGASVLGELPRVGAPAILVPGTFAGGHQALNAKFMADRGAAVVVQDRDLPGGELIRLLGELLDYAPRLNAMSLNSRSMGRPDAAAALFDLVEQIARRPLAIAGSR